MTDPSSSINGGETVATLVDFLNEIGIRTIYEEVPNDTFLPGIAVKNGGLIVDRNKILWPGDLLHEAGHLALVPAGLRESTSGEVTVEGELPASVEAAAMAWSYAAALHVGIDPVLVFHQGGYLGHGRGLLYGFSLGVAPGLHLLQKFGLAFGSNRPAEGIEPFPSMQRWLRE